MQYYEAEVFSLGIWKNFEEMEESLTLSELLRLYSVVRKRDMRQYKMHLRAQGADVTVFDDGPVEADRDEDAFKRIQQNVTQRGMEKARNSEGGDSPFGSGIGFKSI